MRSFKPRHLIWIALFFGTIAAGYTFISDKAPRKVASIETPVAESSPKVEPEPQFERQIEKVEAEPEQVETVTTAPTLPVKKAPKKPFVERSIVAKTVESDPEPEPEFVATTTTTTSSTTSTSIVTPTTLPPLPAPSTTTTTSTTSTTTTTTTTTTTLPMKVEAVVIPPIPLVPNSKPAPLLEKAHKPLFRPEFWVWVGMGENYLLYQQTIPNGTGQAKFQNVQGPTLSFTSGVMGEIFGAEVSYKQTPGRMDSSSTVSVVDGQFTWKNLSGEGLYQVGENSRLRFGVQHHVIPFMDLNPYTAVVTVKSNSLTALSLGFDHTYRISDHLRGEWLMRYQQPISSGGTNGESFTITPELSFDGSLGAVYQTDSALRFGLYWYGQWQQFGFKTSTFTGKQSLFYSNLEFRFGWEF